MKRHHVVLALLSAGLGLVACGGKASEGGKGAAAPAVSGAAAGGAPAAPPTGKTITVEMISDNVGNYFKPADFEARRGDVIHFVLTVGVHNVRFLPDSNPGKQNLPPASDLLQLPGQAYDLPVNLDPGTYFYQCDAHAALGMKGHITVKP
jgi:plastocyanin